MDYCSPVYHSLLTDLQGQTLERLQASALRCIPGYDDGVPYSLKNAGCEWVAEIGLFAVQIFAIRSKAKVK